jgi:hypothetical protein
MRFPAGSGALASAPRGFCRDFRQSPRVGRKLSALLSTIELVFEVVAWNGGARAEVISVCDLQQPVSVDTALVMLERALDALNAADAALLPTGAGGVHRAGRV